MKKRAFTLTELLVVVVIVGVLSAVVLPKFTKILQTRKTTEAENVMAAVRNEQEARCMVGRDYTADTTKLASLPKANSKNYTYSLDKQGITATAKDGEYVLQIPSYTDGRICCSGAGCDALNKDYPKCGSYTLEQATCEAPEVTEIPEPETTCSLSDYTRTCQEEGYSAEYTGSVTYTVNADCTGHTKTDTCTKPSPVLVCTPGEKQVTACTCGVETGKVCNAQGTAWDDYNNGTCALTQAEKDNCSCETKPDAQTRDCETGNGTQTLDYTCQDGHWVAGDWSGECTSQEKDCAWNTQEEDDIAAQVDKITQTVCNKCGHKYAYYDCNKETGKFYIVDEGCSVEKEEECPGHWERVYDTYDCLDTHLDPNERRHLSTHVNCLDCLSTNMSSSMTCIYAYASYGPWFNVFTSARCSDLADYVSVEKKVTAYADISAVPCVAKRKGHIAYKWLGESIGCEAYKCIVD